MQSLTQKKNLKMMTIEQRRNTVLELIDILKKQYGLSNSKIAPKMGYEHGGAINQILHHGLTPPQFRVERLIAYVDKIKEAK